MAMKSNQRKVNNMTLTVCKPHDRMRISICTLAITALIALVAALGATPAYADYSAGQTELSTANAPLAAGDTFKAHGVKYEVLDLDPLDDSAQGTVKLVSYRSKNRIAEINTVSYKGNRYEVRIVGKEAFDTRRGHKVTQVKIGFNVDKIEARAFLDCKKLTRLNMRQADVISINHDILGYYVDKLKIGKKAFKNAGTSNLVVKCGNSKAKYQKAYKRALVKKGMRNDVTVVK